jgi:hypothetical protein
LVRPRFIEVPDEYRREAERLGLDLPRLRAALGDASISRAISADMAIAQRFGLEAAPALFVNGHYLPIRRSRACVSIYAALMRGALPAPISV